MIHKVYFIFNQSNFWSQICEKNSELNSENNCDITIYYTIRPNAFIITIKLMDQKLEVKELTPSKANPENLKILEIDIKKMLKDIFFLFNSF